MLNPLNRLQQKLSSINIEALLVTKHENIHYLCGFTGSWAIMIVMPDNAFLVTDFRYVEQAKKQTNIEVIMHGTPFYEKLNELLMEHKIRNLGFESKNLTYDYYELLKDKLKCKMIPQKDLVEQLRETKTDEELMKIKKAVQISEAAFKNILNIIKPGIKEKELAVELEYLMKKNGAEALSFDIIVASGKRSSLPHGKASNKKLDFGDFVTFDFGCKYQGYCSDMTRTVVLGKVTDKQKKIYTTVLKAQQLAVECIKADMTCEEADAVARSIIEKAGYGKYFGHGLGHGVGLEIHEAPRLTQKNSSKLKAGMVVTIEPGVYIPDFGGVRIEDVVVINKKGCNNLNSFTKELIII